MLVRNYVKTIYRRLPIIRELKQIQKSLFAIQSDARRMAANQLIEFLEFAVPQAPRYREGKRLLRYAHQTYSEHGEDGMIAEIFRRIDAPLRTFVEIGAGDGLQNNTAALLNRGWRGWWIDADRGNVSSIQTNFREVLASGRLSVLEALVTAENVVSFLDRSGVPKEIDLLSLDIDRNTYWVWRAISEVYRPRAAVIEYNASFPADVDWKVKYRPDAQWDGSAYFGASLKAMELVSYENGYSLVGCDFTGVNAFFVRSDLCADRFSEPFTSENHYEPPRYSLAARWGHRPAFSGE